MGWATLWADFLQTHLHLNYMWDGFYSSCPGAKVVFNNNKLCMSLCVLHLLYPIFCSGTGSPPRRTSEGPRKGWWWCGPAWGRSNKFCKKNLPKMAKKWLKISSFTKKNFTIDFHEEPKIAIIRWIASYVAWPVKCWIYFFVGWSLRTSTQMKSS
jgi:hypothetical protein